MNNLVFDIFEVKLGWIGALATDNGLYRITLPQVSQSDCYSMLIKDVAGASRIPSRFTGLTVKLYEYFEGSIAQFDGIQLDLNEISPKYSELWKACMEIPYGQTRSYKWLSIKAGLLNGWRVAGQAMANNRFPIVIPCHRVISSDGSLGGFAGGAKQLGLKSYLLELESSNCY